MSKGKLLVLEGLDGSGKATQAKLLAAHLAGSGRRVMEITFPDYESDSSALVKMYLSGQFGDKPDDVNPYAASSFYAVDRYASYKTKWGSFYEAGGIVIADRYTTSNAVHQCSKLPPEQWDDFLRWAFDYEYRLLGLPAPDAVVYLQVDPVVSLPREVSRNLWSQAEFDSVTARKLCELRERFYPDTVQFPPEQMAVVLTDLYAQGATIVSSEKGYGIYFRREDTLYFVELMAEDDRSAEVLMEAAREKEVIVERAVITVGAAQNLFLGEGTRQDYGMIRFDAEPFDVEESYMRLMMES